MATPSPRLPPAGAVNQRGKEVHGMASRVYLLLAVLALIALAASIGGEPWGI